MKPNLQINTEQEILESHSEKSPGQISVVAGTEFDPSISPYEDSEGLLKNSIQQIPEVKTVSYEPEKQSTPPKNLEPTPPKEDIKKSFEKINEKHEEHSISFDNNSKQIKLIRFNVPFIQGEIQTLTPRKNWELRVANLESLLEAEKTRNNELCKLILSKDNQILSVKAECEASVRNMENDVAIMKSRCESLKAQLEAAKNENEKQANDMTETINQCREQIKTLETQQKWYENHEKELNAEISKKNSEIVELTQKNSRMQAKLEEADISASRMEKQYEQTISRINEERKNASETADSHSAKLMAMVKENEANFAKYQRFSTENSELKERLAKNEESLQKLKDENNSLKVKLGVLENTTRPINEQNQILENVVPLKIIEKPVTPKSENQIENKEIDNKILDQKLKEIKENIVRVEYEKNMTNKERDLFEKEIENQKNACSDLRRDFNEYKRKMSLELQENDKLLKKMQKLVWTKDAEIEELRTELNAQKSDTNKFKEVYTINSYLRNLPSAGIWSEEKVIQEHVYNATKGAIDEAGQEKSKKALEKLNEEIEFENSEHKKTLKKLYGQTADEIITKNDFERENSLKNTEDRFSANLEPGRNQKSYLKEFS